MVENEKTCLSCGSLIPVAASKCHRCGSFQNWKRHLDIGNSTLSLLIALFSVIGISSTQLESLYNAIWLGGNDNVVAAVITEINEDSINILLANEGSTSVTLDQVICNIYPLNPGVGIQWSHELRRYLMPSKSDVGPQKTYFYRSPPILLLPDEHRVWSASLGEIRTVAEYNGPATYDPAKGQTAKCFFHTQTATGSEKFNFIKLDPLFYLRFIQAETTAE